MLDVNDKISLVKIKDAKLTIDGSEIEVEEGLTVMQACEAAGIEIPHFVFMKD